MGSNPIFCFDLHQTPSGGLCLYIYIYSRNVSCDVKTNTRAHSLTHREKNKDSCKVLQMTSWYFIHWQQDIKAFSRCLAQYLEIVHQIGLPFTKWYKYILYADPKAKLDGGMIYSSGKKNEFSKDLFFCVTARTGQVWTLSQAARLAKNCCFWCTQSHFINCIAV